MIKKSIFSLSIIIAAGLAFTPALTNADPCVAAQGKAAAGSILADDTSSAPSQDQMSNGSSDQSNQSSDQSSDQSGQDNSGMSSTTDSGSMGSTGSDGSSDDSNSSE